jgi:hypothetical protein
MSKILVLTMHKVGSTTMLNGLKEAGHIVDRGYEENVDSLDLENTIDTYDAIYTAVRDPVARNISWFFEVNGNRVLQEGTRLERIKEELLEMDHQYALTWFDDVFFPIVGIDIYKYDFPDSGVFLLGNICVLRTEQMQFEHKSDTVLTKQYGDLYKEFRDWVKFDDEYLDKMYSSKYVKHFFSPREIEEMREKWQE